MRFVDVLGQWKIFQIECTRRVSLFLVLFFVLVIFFLLFGSQFGRCFIVVYHLYYYGKWKGKWNVIIISRQQVEVHSMNAILFAISDIEAKTLNTGLSPRKQLYYYFVKEDDGRIMD